MRAPEKSPLVFHPFLFAILPVLSLLSYNIDGAAIEIAFRPVAFSLIGAALVVAILWLLFKDWHRAGIVSSIFLMLFFSYGHVYGGFLLPNTHALFTQGGLVGKHGVLLSVWAVLLGLGVIVAVRLRAARREATRALNLIALIAVIMPAWRIVYFEWNLRQPWPSSDFGAAATVQLQTVPDSMKPDIYYIILDGYGGSDVLSRDYQYDNAEFIGFLESRGFFVAGKSQANYAQTVLSLSSSLNMSYLDFLSQNPGAESVDHLPSSRLIRSSQVGRLLKEQGYTLVAFATGNRATEMENFDLYFRPKLAAATMFERLTMDTSLLVVWHDLAEWLGLPAVYLGYQAHRDRINFALDGLTDAAQIAGPKFVFVHVIVPHPPFVFHADGAPVDPRYPFSLMDGDLYLGSPQEYVQGYQEQLAFIDARMRPILDQLLDNPSRPVIVVVQGDHGPGAYLQWNTPSEQALSQRFSILNAYYFSEGVDAPLYDRMTPVNTFRMIFNTYFGAQLPLLPDKSYYSTLGRPYQFTEVR